ncbi:rRNA biogenesis protein rrp36 [Coemansia sp. Benny D115]|nr:rRNA biogenesis protein rrp36 [Coemansia sp. Benny D115]
MAKQVAGKQFAQYSSDEDSSSGGSGSEGEHMLQSDADSDIESGSEDEVEGEHMLQSDADSDIESGSEDEVEVEETKKKTKAELLRQQLSEVPFSQLIRIQQQMGLNKFNESMGIRSSKGGSKTKKDVKKALRRQAFGADAASSDEESDSSASSDDSGPETVSNARAPSKGAVDLHRASRKMPSMMSSKKPVRRFRQVVDMAGPKTRDPRFDNLSGNYNEDLFEKSYGFLDDMQKDEIQAMRGQLDKLKKSDPEEAQRMQLAIDSLQSRAAAKKQRQHAQELKRQHRAKERDAVKQGKTPYFLKKRDMRNIEIAEKFSKLKDSSKLDGFIEKRRKRNATKDHRNMPYQRRED